MGKVSKVAICIMVLMLLVACGESKPEKDILVGTWVDEKNADSVIFLEDGTLLSYKDVDCSYLAGQGNWKWVEEGKKVVFNSGYMAVQYEVTIKDNNHILFKQKHGDDFELVRKK
ncbi:hypothetical protein V6C27_13815 [Peptococcaceae bacterium 1198_IL3148]